MDTLIGLIVFLATTVGLYFGMRLIFEREEMPYIHAGLLPYSVVAALVFWGAGRIDPHLDAYQKFIVALAVTIVATMIARAVSGGYTRIILSINLSILCACLGLILATAAVYVVTMLFPSSTFTPPLSRDTREACAPARSLLAITQAVPKYKNGIVQTPLAPGRILRYTTGHEERIST